MAGIGFRLQRLLSDDSYTATLKAYAYSGLIAAGPFLLTISVVVLIDLISIESLAMTERVYFQNMVTYAFAFAFVALGVSQMVVTRYAADAYYRKHTGHFTAVFFSSFALNTLVWGPLVLWFFSGLSVSWMAKLSGLILFESTLGSWLALIFLSAAKDYPAMVRAFVLGATISFLGAAALGPGKGMEGYMAGFTLGQTACFFLLASAVIREFGYRETSDWHWLAYFRRHWRLAVMGTVYNLAIWADKVLFWFSPEGRALDKGFVFSPVYDAPMFFSYLTVVPSLAYFLFRMETDFFLKYRAYFQAIEKQESLAVLERRRESMVASLTYNFMRLVILQGIVSILSLLAVPWLVQGTGMDPIQMGILRIGIFASFLQVGLLIVINVLLYFDFQPEALACSAAFLLLNTGLTAVSLNFGLPAYGYGYTLACFLSLALAFYLLNDRLRLLHFWTFVRQPMPRMVPAIEE